MFGVFCMVTKPAGCGICGPLESKQFGFCGCEGSGVGKHPGGGEAALAAPKVLNNTPAEAVVSLEATVLLTNSVLKESCSDTPAPSHPATLFAMMLLVTVMPYQRSGFFTNAATSLPLVWRKRSPPPLPSSALLPRIRFESITRFGPVPSPMPGGQSRSVTPPHSWPFGKVRSS
jgi:hypothetical protein